MKLSRKARAEIQSRPVKSLARDKDEKGNRLHASAIKAEIARRVKAHQSEHPAIVRHKAKVASRKLK